MRVILLKDIPTVGQKRQIKEVAAGYALNFLIPRGLAQKAEAGLVRQMAELENRRRLESENKAAGFKTALQKISGQKVTIKAPANEQGHLFKGIGREDLAAAVLKEWNLRLEPAFFELEKPIKAVGEFEIKFKEAAGRLKVAIEAV